MADDQTTLKQKVRSGAPLLGAAVPMFSDRARLAQIAARHRYDWFQVDAQHSAFAEVRLRDFCAIAGELSMPVVLRIKHTRHTYLIGNLLDLGPVGIEVPQVELESTVDEAVANFYYAPQGVRSWGGVNRVNFAAGVDHRQYRKWWGETGVLWMQIESVASVTAARHLAKPGVDCLSFGPMDLTISLEAHPGHPFKTVDDCVQHTVDQLRGSGTAVCFRIPSAEERQKYIDMGVTVLLESPSLRGAR
jgi:2-keto-3-deoxy-L-rhamnonate aldolase RhmA